MNKFTAEIFATRLAEANLITRQLKANFDTILISLNMKINPNKTKHVLVENEFKKLQTFDSIYFRSKIHLPENDTKNYLVFQPIGRYLKGTAGVSNGNYVYFWRSKRLSDKMINSITTFNYTVTPELSYYGNKIRVKFNRFCLKQDKTTFNHGKTNSKCINCL